MHIQSQMHIYFLVYGKETTLMVEMPQFYIYRKFFIMVEI
jgi:hypothetical protein